LARRLPRREFARLGALGALVWVGAGCRPAVVETAPPRPAPRETLAPGDEIDVRVFDEKRFEGAYEVDADGTIDFPFIGAIAVAGMNAQQVADALEERLADGYLQHPQVTVTIKARENSEVSVLGQVNRPGSLPFQERITLVQAVSAAGGLTAYAAPRRVKITRRTGEGDQTRTFEVSLAAIIDGAAEDLTLQAGDIVFIPESRL
jgi:protein involved in polysaccharide export with SLBB domain